MIATKFGRHAGEHSVRYTPEDIMDALDSSLKVREGDSCMIASVAKVVRMEV